MKGYNFFEKLLIRLVPSFNVNYNIKKPNILRVELTNNCTAKCVYCPRKEVHKRGTGFMSEKLFKKIITEGKALGVDKVGLAGSGEPLLHPDFFKFLDIIKNKDMKIRLATNAMLLNDETARKLINYPLESVEFSFDGINREQYASGKGVDGFDVAKKNILNFLDLVRKRKKNIKFNIHFVDIGNLSFWDKVKYVNYWESKFKGLRHDNSFFYKEMNWAGANSKKMRTFWEFLETRKPCSQLNGVTITFDGKIYQCSCNPFDDGIIGDVKKGIASVFACNRKKQLMKEHKSGRFSGRCAECSANSFFPLVRLSDFFLILIAKCCRTIKGE